MRNQRGFTLIEVIIFIIVSGILASTILLSFTNGLKKTPTLLDNSIAGETARKCIEWFLGQRQLLGYSSFSCPGTTVPTFCSKPTGYTIAVNIACTTINSDSNYQTITVAVSGNGNAKITTLVANY